MHLKEVQKGEDSDCFEAYIITWTISNQIYLR